MLSSRTMLNIVCTREASKLGWISEVCPGEQQGFWLAFIPAQLSTLRTGANLDQLLMPPHFMSLLCNLGCHFIMSDSKKERDEGGKEERKRGREGGKSI